MKQPYMEDLIRALRNAFAMLGVMATVILVAGYLGGK